MNPLTIILGIIALMAIVFAAAAIRGTEKANDNAAELRSRLQRFQIALDDMEYRFFALDRKFEIVTDSNRATVVMHIRMPLYNSDCKIAGHNVRKFPVKVFHFADDPDFAMLQAQELLDKLNEK